MATLSSTQTTPRAESKPRTCSLSLRVANVPFQITPELKQWIPAALLAGAENLNGCAGIIGQVLMFVWIPPL